MTRFESNPRLVRSIGERLADLSSLATDAPEAREIALSELELLAIECKEGRLNMLLAAVNDARIDLLEKLERLQAIILLLLETAQANVGERGSLFTLRWSVDRITRLRRLLPASDLDGYQVLRLRLALRLGEFRTVEQVLQEVDPDREAAIDASRGQIICEIRLLEAKALLMHKSTKEAIEAVLRLADRVTADTPKDLILRISLLALQIARAALDKITARSIRNQVQLLLDKIEPTTLKGERLALLGHIQALDAHLEFTFAEEGAELNIAYRRWLQLNESIVDDQAWAYYFIDRIIVGNSRGLIEFKEEPRRLAASTIISAAPRKRASRNVADAGAYLAAKNYHSALEQVYIAMDIALEDNDWSAWLEAKSLVSLLYLADNCPLQAAQAFILDDVYCSESVFIADLETCLGEEHIADIVELATEHSLPSARRARGWTVLLTNSRKIGIKSRGQIIDFAEGSMKNLPKTKAASHEREQLLKLLGSFFRCPTDDETPRLIELFLSLLDIGSTKAEALKFLKNGFWSATGPRLSSSVAEKLLRELSGRILSGTIGDDTEPIVRIALALIQDQGQSQSVVDSAQALINKHGLPVHRQEALAARAEVELPPGSVEEALKKAMDVLARRIEKLSDGSIRTALTAESLNEVGIFLSYFSQAQVSQLYDGMISAGLDPEADSHLRWQVFEFIKNPAFQKLSSVQLKKGIEMLYQRLELRHSENVFDKSHRQANSSHFSGLKVEPDREQRIQRDALIALAVFESNPGTADPQRYTELLWALVSAGTTSTRRGVATSIQVYFECSGPSHPLLEALTVRLVSDGDTQVVSAGIEVAATELVASSTIAPLTFSLLDSIYRSSPSLDKRIALAVFCRKAVTSSYRGDHQREILRWHSALSKDESPVVRKYADTLFWNLPKHGLAFDAERNASDQSSDTADGSFQGHPGWPPTENT